MADRPVPARRPPSLTLPPPRRSLGSLLVAVLLHAGALGAILYSRWQELETWEAVEPAGAGEASSGGGGGGGGIQVVVLPAWQEPTPAAPVPPPPVLPPPEPVAVVDPEPPPLAAPADSVPAGASPGLGGTGTGGGSGSGTGTGQGSGTGPGTGAGSGGGRGAGGSGTGGWPPEPRQLILPPLDYPEGLRGRTIAVTFWVNTDGRVERVALDPAIEDRGFERRFIDVMKNYRFRPARSAEGTPLPATTTISVTF